MKPCPVTYADVLVCFLIGSLGIPLLILAVERLLS